MYQTYSAKRLLDSCSLSDMWSEYNGSAYLLSQEEPLWDCGILQGTHQPESQPPDSETYPLSSLEVVTHSRGNNRVVAPKE
jgi:hypothetical protein